MARRQGDPRELAPATTRCPGRCIAIRKSTRLEIRRIFMLRPGSTSGTRARCPERGDYFLFEIAGESVIVVRDAEGGINALHERLPAPRLAHLRRSRPGHESRLVCRYHGWTYGLDGALRAAAHMPQGFDRSQLGLRRLHTRVFMGLIFVNFADEPPAFEPIERDLGEPLRPYGLDRAKVAHRQNYPITSNWKLAIENYCECYHCGPAHPEYSVGAWPGGPAGAVGSHAGGGHGSAHPRSGSRSTRSAVLARIRRPGRRPGLRPLSAAPRPSDRQPRRQAGRAAARDRSRVTTAARRTCISGPMTFGARVLRSRGAVPVHAARAAQHRLRDHLAGQRVGPSKARTTTGRS